MNITNKIEHLRKEKGWSVARLAREANIPTVSLRVMLSRQDSNNYSVTALIKIANVLGVSVSELTKTDEEESAKPKLSSTQMELLKETIEKTIETFFETEIQKKKPGRKRKYNID